MRKKLTRTQLIQDIRDTMPDNLSESDQAAFIEKAVADNVVFDEEYLWSDRETKRKIYKLAKQEAQRPKEDVKRKLICINIAELYVYVARKFGLNVGYQRIAVADHNGFMDGERIGSNEILDEISEDTLDHVCPILNLSDGRKIRVDIQGDLENLKTRSKTSEFGTNDDESRIDVLSQEEIDSVFRMIYGLEDSEKFTDEYIESLNNKLSKEQLLPIEKIKRIIEDSRIQQEVKHLGVNGLKKFYKGILREVLGIPTTGIYFANGTRANISICSISNAKGKQKHSVFLYAQDWDTEVCYIFSKKNRQMVSITPEELYQMGTQSMIIRPTYTPEERNMQTDIIDQSMRGFIKRGENSVKQKAEKNGIDMDEFFVGDYDEEEEEK